MPTRAPGEQLEGLMWLITCREDAFVAHLDSRHCPHCLLVLLIFCFLFFSSVLLGNVQCKPS